MKRVICLLLLAVLAGCDTGAGGDTEPGEGAGPAGFTDKKSLAIDGFVVVSGGAAGGLHLFDPATGQASQHQMQLFNGPDSVAISPDGQRIAWVTTKPKTSDIVIEVAEAVVVDGRPELHVLRTFDVEGGGVFWNEDGDRLYSNHMWLDPDTGAAWDCRKPGQGPGGTYYKIAPIPGSHRYACSEAQALFEDGVKVADVGGTEEYLSTDGQWFGPYFHVPSLATRTFPPNSFYTPVFQTQYGQPLKLPDGRWVTTIAGKDGKLVVEGVSGAGGWTTVYSIVDMHDKPQAGIVWDMHDVFTGGSHEAKDQWPMKHALTDYLGDGDGRGWSALAVSGDGQRLMWTVESWKVTESRGIPHNTTIDMAVVEVDPTGKSRGFKLSQLGQGLHGVERAATESGRLELGDGDWVMPAIGSGTPSGQRTWLGSVGGKPVVWPDAGTPSSDGSLFFGWRQGQDGKQRLCLRKLQDKQLGASECVLQPLPGAPIGLMARGQAAHAQDGPVLLAVNRRAAYPGAIVQVDGVRFGTGGKLTIGDVEVPAADLLAWTDRRIRFAMTDKLPLDGEIRVTTAAGTAGTHRRFRLHRTLRAQTPFDGIAPGTKALGQGLNLVDLGELGDFSPAHGDQVALDPKMRLADGRYVVWSAGAAKPEPYEVTLFVGNYVRPLRFDVGTALVDTASWQLVQPAGDFSGTQPAFVTIAGDLIERQAALHPVGGERITLARVQDRLPFGGAVTFGLPDFWREIPGGALTLNRFGGAPKYGPMALGVLTGWTGADGVWGTPQYAPAPSLALPLHFYGAAADGDLVLAVGADPLGSSKLAYLFSQDGGKTLGPVQLADVPGGAAFREPVLVQAKTGSFFLALDGATNDPTVKGVHAIAKDGTVTPHVAQVPPDAQLVGGTLLNARLTVATVGGRVALHFGGKKTLVVLDFDQDVPAPRPWTVAPAAADQGHVRSVFDDPKTRDLYAIRDDGQVARATAAGLWADWQPVDLGFDLALPTQVIPWALGRLPDGRFVTLAQLQAADGKSASPLGPFGWLVGPKP